MKRDEKDEIIYREFAKFAPIFIGMMLCLFAEIQFLLSGAQTTTWRLWVPLGVFLVLVLITEIMIRHLKKKVTEYIEEI